MKIHWNVARNEVLCKQFKGRTLSLQSQIFFFGKIFSTRAFTWQILSPRQNKSSFRPSSVDFDWCISHAYFVAKAHITNTVDHCFCVLLWVFFSSKKAASVIIASRTSQGPVNLSVSLSLLVIFLYTPLFAAGTGTEYTQQTKTSKNANFPSITRCNNYALFLFACPPDMGKI